MPTRETILDHVRSNPDVSVLIIGGGINGIGTFRDLALQGVDVLLVERSDFCSGASAASSHMVHGGIRYLENGEFRLVREAVEERNRLIENAPHYVRPLPTVIPIFKWFSGLLNAPLKFLGWLDRPAERGAIVIKIGLLLYDAYTRAQGTVPNHRFRSRQDSLQKFPRLNPAIRSTATYYDAAMRSPERICIDLLADARAANTNAVALNYCPVVGTEGDVVLLQDQMTGETFQVRPQIVINAAGPWIDFTNRSLGAETRFVGGTKGSHLVLDQPELRAAIGENEFFFENDDGRIVLVYPYEDRVLVGTSDIPIDNPDEAVCTPTEIDYFLEMIGKIFPEIRVTPEEIVFRFSGVRPLPASDAKSAGQISRDHEIRILEPDHDRPFPVLSLVGGKWTTFRAFSEQTADRVLGLLGRPRKVSTRSLPIGGGKGYPRSESDRRDWIATTSAKTGLDPDRTAVLLDRYGTRAADLADWIAAGPDRPLSADPSYSRREIGWLAENEQVAHIDDLLLRRSLLAMLGRVSSDLVKELAGVIAEVKGWSEEETHAEIKRTQLIFQDRHGVILDV